MNIKHIFGKATILLITIILVFSIGIVSANTIKIDSNISPAVLYSKAPIETTSYQSMEVNTNTMPTERGLLWDNGVPWEANGCGNGKGENTLFGKVWLEAADDFIADDAWIISSGHFEGLCFNSNLQVDEVLIRFFDDNGNVPAEVAFYEEYSTDFTVIDYYDPGSGWYHTEIDVNFPPVLVIPGSYWVQMTPCGLLDDWHYSSIGTTVHGDYCAVRDGDSAWGGGYGSFTWIQYSPMNDLCFRLFGEVAVAQLNIQNVTGGLGCSADIVNTGQLAAENVNWELKFEGGIIISPTNGIVTGGPVTIPALGSLGISSTAFGFGGIILPLNIVITATADNADPVSVSYPAKLFLILVSM